MYFYPQEFEVNMSECKHMNIVMNNILQEYIKIH